MLLPPESGYSQNSHARRYGTAHLCMTACMTVNDLSGTSLQARINVPLLLTLITLA